LCGASALHLLLTPSAVGVASLAEEPMFWPFLLPDHDRLDRATVVERRTAADLAFADAEASLARARPRRARRGLERPARQHLLPAAAARHLQGQEVPIRPPGRIDSPPPAPTPEEISRAA
jgi:hypothetical protein